PTMTREHIAKAARVVQRRRRDEAHLEDRLWADTAQGQPLTKRHLAKQASILALDAKYEQAAEQLLALHWLRGSPASPRSSGASLRCSRRCATRRRPQRSFARTF